MKDPYNIENPMQPTEDEPLAPNQQDEQDFLDMMEIRFLNLVHELKKELPIGFEGHEVIDLIEVMCIKGEGVDLSPPESNETGD